MCMFRELFCAVNYLIFIDIVCQRWKKSQMGARYREAQNQVEMYYFVIEYTLYTNNSITYVNKNYQRN